MEANPNSPNVTLSVWSALFLREAVSRLLARRSAWLWLLVEPVLHIAFLLFIFVALRVHLVGGVDTFIWLMIGLLAFFMFRRTAMQTMNAISSNRVFFAYRQVKPVDSVLVRAVLEGFLMVLVSVIVFAGAALLGYDVIPHDALAVLGAFVGLWAIGLGFGLMASVIIELIPETAVLMRFGLRVLYVFSGVMAPMTIAPTPYREWLMLNPIPHALEAARLGFAPHYHAAPELSMGYVYFVALAAIFFGLALQVRYSTRMVMQ